MSQAQRVPGLMQGDAEHIHIRSNFPAVIVVEMLVAGNRLRVERIRIERVRQHSCRAGKRISIPMCTAGKQHGQRPRPGGIGGLSKRNLHILSPFRVSALDFRFHRIRRLLLGNIDEGIAQIGASQPRPIPSIAYQRNSLPHRTGMVSAPAHPWTGSPRIKSVDAGKMYDTSSQSASRRT